METVIFSIFIFILGLSVGSFLNCLIWRLHKRKSLAGRSICPECGRKIFWYDNIPVLSFILLRGRCRHCGKPISWQYPAVELVAAFLFLLTFLNYELRATSYELRIDDLLFLSCNLFFISVMIVIFIYDLKWYLILDIITLPAAAVMFIFNLALGFNWLNLLFSAIIGGSFFLLQFLISRGKWIGGGDIRLGLLLGISLGWPKIILAILLAYLLGSLVGLGLIASGRKKWGEQVPLGVFLSTAAVITLFFGKEIIDWYLKFFIF